MRLGDYAGSKLQRMANWPSFDSKLQRMANCPSSILSRNGASGPCVENSRLQSRPIPLDSSRKMTNTSISLRQQGLFLTSPGEKGCVLKNPVSISAPIIVGLRIRRKILIGKYFVPETRLQFVFIPKLLQT